MDHEYLDYRCIKCGRFRLKRLNKFYYQCLDPICQQVHEIEDAGKVIKEYKPITFLNEESNDL